jgi:hypothetical protein
MAAWCEVTEDVYLDDYDFDTGGWMPRLVAREGEVVCLYQGATYGVISRDGVACTRFHPLHTPFFEMPRRALRALPAHEVADAASPQAGVGEGGTQYPPAGVS